MKYPEFFDTVESIKLKDDLANVLGTFSSSQTPVWKLYYFINF